MSELEKLRARKRELDTQISEYPYWGAAITAMDEERRGIERQIAALIAESEADPT